MAKAASQVRRFLLMESCYLYHTYSEEHIMLLNRWDLSTLLQEPLETGNVL